jgi:hypothetical protein
MKTTLGNAPRCAPRVWMLTLALCAALGSALLVVAVSASNARAFATVAPPSNFSSASGLPDGRGYEEVSPPDKNGFTAGVKKANGEVLPIWGTAAADGNAMLFWGDGPIGEAFSGLDSAFVASHTSGAGWSTRSATPRPYGEYPNTELRFLYYSLSWVYASADLSHLAFSSWGAWAPPPDEIGQFMSLGGNSNIFLAGPDPSVPATWIGRPSLEPTKQIQLQEPIPVGGTPDLSTVYFTSLASLLPADAARRANGAAWGFYEFSDGALHEAGVLPDGSLDPLGSVPAASANFVHHTLRIYRHENEVSADGSRAFFVSPDPLSGSANPPQLYVRKTAPDGSKSSVLVSQAQLPGHVGQQAPDGPALGGVDLGAPYNEPNQYFFASSDGSHAFFTSQDQLTSEAPDATVLRMGPAGQPVTVTVTINGVSDTTGLLPSEPSSAEVQSAIGTLGNVGVGHVAVSREGSGENLVFTVTFTGLEHATATTNPQNFGYSFPYGIPIPPTFQLTVKVDGSEATTPPIASSASPAEIQSALEALSDVGAGNVTVGASNIKFAESLVANKKVELHSNGLEIEGGSRVLGNATPTKEYDFDLDTGVLKYIPNVAGGIVAAAHDGSWFLFENRTTSPTELDLWTDGAGGGSVKPVTQLPGGPARPVQVSGGGSVIVFSTSAAIPGFNNGAGSNSEVYRYDVAGDSLSCVSCPGAGATPSGASLTKVFEPRPEFEPGSDGDTFGVNEPRDVSADGSRVFFQTADALVPQDTNGVGDVYEWENGTVFLVSSGIDSEPSELLDGSETGGDVFFASAQGLVPGDTDGGFDVYDARIPQPGDSPPVSAVPCQGDVCQGPPSVASLLGAPASATYSGLGNAAPSKVAAKPKPKRKVATKCAKGKKRSRGKCVKAKAKRKKAKKATTNGRAK